MRKLLFLVPFLIANNCFAFNTTTTNKATATLAATCTIDAQNIAFGALLTPLSAQSSTSHINILCNKNAAYTIGLAYGGIYGQGTGIVKLPYSNMAYSTSNGYTFQTCYYSATIDGSTYTTSEFFIYNGYNRCSTSVSYGTPAYDYGRMVGVAKGDFIGYFISIPGDSSKVWNTGNNSYSGTGTGVTQTLPLNAKIIPNQSGSNYPTPDLYTDTVTATINF